MQKKVFHSRYNISDLYLDYDYGDGDWFKPPLEGDEKAPLMPPLEGDKEVSHYNNESVH